MRRWFKWPLSVGASDVRVPRGVLRSLLHATFFQLGCFFVGYKSSLVLPVPMVAGLLKRYSYYCRPETERADVVACFSALLSASNMLLYNAKHRVHHELRSVRRMKNNWTDACGRSRFALGEVLAVSAPSSRVLGLPALD